MNTYAVSLDLCFSQCMDVTALNAAEYTVSVLTVMCKMLQIVKYTVSA